MPVQPPAQTSLLLCIVPTLVLKVANVIQVMFSVAAAVYSVMTVAVSIMAFITPVITLSGQAPVVKKVNAPSAALAGLLGKCPASMSPVRRVRCVWQRWACWVATLGGRECVQSLKTL